MPNQQTNRHHVLQNVKTTTHISTHYTRVAFSILLYVLLPTNVNNSTFALLFDATGAHTRGRAMAEGLDISLVAAHFTADFVQVLELVEKHTIQTITVVDGSQNDISQIFMVIRIKQRANVVLSLFVKVVL